MDHPRFGPCAQRLAGLACRAFGWTPDTFWNATPAELAAILTTDETDVAPPLGRDELAQLMERDTNG